MLFIALTLENLQALGYESFEDLYVEIQNKYFGIDCDADILIAKKLADCLSPEQKIEAKEYLIACNYYDKLDSDLAEDEIYENEFYSIFN